MKHLDTVKLPEDWKQALSGVLRSPQMANLRAFLRKEKVQGGVYPPFSDTFRAFWASPLSKTRVVILGQDPYHGANQAMGLAFSVPQDMPKPPSLVNVFKELEYDIGAPMPRHGDLTAWAQQGVLLLNSVLSVRPGKPGSHKNQGWEVFTDAVIDAVNVHTRHSVFILWGSYAKQKGRFIDTQRHLVLTAAHPSPLSANRGGFFGSRPFSQTNAYLVRHDQAPIDWTLPF